MPVPAPPPPTTDAKKCLTDFFQYLELELKHRVAAKTGRSQRLDMARLSNLMASASAAHSLKPRTPLSSSKARSASLDHVHISLEQKQKLRDVYIYYCSWGEKMNHMFMSRSQFLRFARDTYICVGSMDSVALNLIFEKVYLRSKEPAPGVRLSMQDWLQSLTIISAQLHPEVSLQEAFDAVVRDHIMCFVGERTKIPDPLAQVMLQPDILELLAQARPRLQAIFDYYVRDQELMTHSAGNSGLARGGSPGAGASFKDILAARACLPLESLYGFTYDFELVPRLLSKAQVATAFRAAKFGGSVQRAEAGRSSGAGNAGGSASAAGSTTGSSTAGAGRGPHNHDPMRLNFQEFVDCVGRCALTAFNYKEPVPPTPVISFSQSYHSDAKRLWLEEEQRRRQEEMEFPDEVDVPAAYLEHGIGNEDTAHWDDAVSIKITGNGNGHVGNMSMGPGARPVTHAYSMVSRRSMRIRKQESHTQGGCDVLRVHDEPEQLEVDRPLHLLQWTPDWIGRVAMPLNETAKLKHPKVDPLVAQGIYHNEVGLPPIYYQRRQAMEEARAVREQHLERLRLKYQVERRQRDKSAHASATQRRMQLQGQSQQLVYPGYKPSTAPAKLQGGPGGHTTQSVGAAPTDTNLMTSLSASIGGLKLGSTGGPCSTTLISELQSLLDVDSQIPAALPVRSSLPARATIRFG